jgi:methylene-tetrahydromethanopterin dehydrogenase
MKTDRLLREDTMADKHILHMVTPLKHMSPFDVNMALDAGFDAVVTYSNVTLDEVTGLVQDAIFSRPPKIGVRTGMFFGGKNATLALDMLSKAKKALVPPFGISFFADPNGSFTTAAAMVAYVEKTLAEKKKLGLKGRRIAVFGATGVVGFSAAVIAGLEGADITLVGYDGIKRVSDAAKEIKTRFDVDVRSADGSDDAKKAAILGDAEVALCAGRAGVTILSRAQLAAAPRLLIVADVNAVPPAGVEGLEMTANGAELTPQGALGIGPLAIGNIKYKTESGLFEKMIAAAKPVQFDFRNAFALARELLAPGLGAREPNA